MLGSLPTDDLAVRDLHGSSAVDRCIDAPILACCMDVGKAGLRPAGEISTGPGSGKPLGRPLHNLPRELAFRGLWGGGRSCVVRSCPPTLYRGLPKTVIDKTS